MNQKKCSMGLILYELKNIAGNPFTVFFGFGFTIILSIVICFSLKVQIPDKDLYQAACIGVFINMGMIIPMGCPLCSENSAQPMGYS